MLAEEKRGRKEANCIIEEERRDREEERRDWEEEGEKANQILEEERRGREEERQGREKSELVTQLTTLPELLGGYQPLFLTVKVEKNVGEACKRAGRKYPKRIVPWNDFVNRQQEIWKTIRVSLTYSQRLFDPLDTISIKTLVAVRSEADVAINEGVAVLQSVEAILQELSKDGRLREQLQLLGYVTFVNHLNLNPGSQEASTLPKTDLLPSSSSPITPPNQVNKRKRAGVEAATKGQNYPNDVRGQADEFCIFKLEDGKENPVYSIAF